MDRPEQKIDTCSGIILCGGKSSRMEYENKCLLRVRGRTFIEIIKERMESFFAEVLLVTKEPHLYELSSCKIVEDIFPSFSSLTGIHAGLVNSSSFFNLVVGCDTPLIRGEVISLLLSQISPEVDVVIPKIRGFYEPLCAIYSKRCIPVIERLLQEKRFAIREVFKYVSLKEISEEEVAISDPSLVSFFNINTPEDYKRLLEIYLYLF